MEPVSNKAGKYGYKDKKTGKVLPFIYDDARSFNDNEALVLKGSMYQLIDQKGKKLVDLPYPGVKFFKKGEYMFQGDTVWGIVSSTGQILARMAFAELYRNGVIENLFIAKKGNRIGIFSTTSGLVLPMEYECNEFTKVFCWDSQLYFQESSPLTLKHDGKWGVMELRGKIILPFEYEYLRPVKGYLNEAKGYLGATKNNKCGLIDYQGKEIIPFEYDYFLGQYINKEIGENDPYVFMKNGKIIFYDLGAKKVIKKVPQGNDSYSTSECCILSKENKKGLIDTLGNILIPFEHELIEFGGGVFFENQAWPTCRVINGKTCALYVPGVGLKTPVLECRSLERGKAYDKIFYISTKGDECTLLDTEFKPILKVDFKNFSFSQNKIFIYDSDGKSGFVTSDGKITWE